jgi:hypothetical protein
MFFQRRWALSGVGLLIKCETTPHKKVRKRGSASLYVASDASILNESSPRSQPICACVHGTGAEETNCICFSPFYMVQSITSLSSRSLNRLIGTLNKRREGIGTHGSHASSPNSTGLRGNSRVPKGVLNFDRSYGARLHNIMESGR